jgi:hypothetical protein
MLISKMRGLMQNLVRLPAATVAKNCKVNSANFLVVHEESIDLPKHLRVEICQ